MTDAELREQLLAYRNESIGLMVLRDKGTISQAKFEKQSFETTERHLQLITARDAAIRIDELKRIMQIPFITQHVYYDERVAELRLESDQAKEEL